MKIAHLTTTLEGGAANAVIRINHALNESGVQSEIFARKIPHRKIENTENILELNRIQKFQSSALTLLQRTVIQKSTELMTPISLDFFHDDFEVISEFDIIHLHSTYNFVGLKSYSLLSKLEKPIFITLHDQRFLTGGCHYSSSCTEFEKNCSNCPKVSRIFQPLVRNSFKNETQFLSGKKLTLISPSNWLNELVKKSAKFSENETHVIRNPIPSKYFIAPSTQEIEVGTLSKKKTIGFISANLNNPYKGLHILIEALNVLASNSPNSTFDLLLVGNGDVPMSSGNFGIRRVISGSDEEMISTINEMDLLVVPSIEDNSPSVIGEAVAAGVPVIGSRVGGITELLAEMDLPLFQPGDSLDLERVLSLFFQGRITFSVEKVQRDAIRFFGSDEFARKQIELYGKKSRI